MKQFVNTSERIWTLQSTAPGHATCEFNQMRRINQESIIYNSTFFRGIHRHSTRQRGDFVPREPKRMDVTTLSNMVRYSVETLIYASKNFSCGVIKMEMLIGRWNTYYDLRVRNSSIESRNHGCKKHFRRFAEQARYIYHPECQQQIKFGI
uniref:Lipocalin n=1 Tax=Rhipicephalus zambeziensis TaxID=60191 RepID=A0A224YL82_9ACAR